MRNHETKRESEVKYENKKHVKFDGTTPVKDNDILCYKMIAVQNLKSYDTRNRTGFIQSICKQITFVDGRLD